MTIRKVKAEELLELQQISVHTFYESFSSQNTEENMRQYVEDSFSLERLGDELLDTHSEFYFAILNQEIIGYLKLNMGPSQTEIRDSSTIEIERIYVYKAHQGKQVGKHLLDHAIQLARDRNAKYVWLGVWEENHNAIQFYRRNGFVVFDKHLFRLGQDEQTDIMMKRILSESS